MGKIVRQHEINSQSHNESYIITEIIEVKVSCTCLGFENHKRCKHTLAYVAAQYYHQLSSTEALAEAEKLLSERG